MKFLQLVFLSLFLAAFSFDTLAADEARRLTDMAAITFERFVSERKDEVFLSLIGRAKGILICPQLLKGAFLFGVSGGNCVFLLWQEKERAFTGPAFYTLGGISLGLQAGGSSSEALLLYMSSKGVRAMMGSSVRLGFDVGIAFGPSGAGAKVETANLSADIIAYYKSKGLFGGLSLDGGVIKVRNDLNEIYYGKKIAPSEIFFLRPPKQSGAERFTQILKKSIRRE